MYLEQGKHKRIESFKQNQYKHVERLIKEEEIFNGDTGNGKFWGQKRTFVLQDAKNNLYAPIVSDCLAYFEKNKISWWGGNLTRHALSSQIACLNHLFTIRKDKEAILKLVQQVESGIEEILEIPTDNETGGYIQFEATSLEDHLNEGKVTRGNNCTAIDALICGRHKDGRRILFPIEWKHMESYSKEDKAIGESGAIRKARYDELISQSEQLKENNRPLYYYEPFYQLMRQTLWAEQMIRFKTYEAIKADDYIHIHIVPKENRQLLDKDYSSYREEVSNEPKGMKMMWEQCLKDPSKYRTYSPEVFLMPLVEEPVYDGLMAYLRKRYWTSFKDTYIS